MAIAIDGSVSSNAITSSQTSTLAHTINSSNDLLLAWIYCRDSTSLGDRTPDTVTYNGVSMTNQRDDDASGASLHISCWYMYNPPTGTNNIAVDMGGSVITTWAIVGIAFSGVDSTTPIEGGNTAQGTGTIASVNTTTTTANAWIVNAMITTEDPASNIGIGEIENVEQVEVSMLSDNALLGTRGPEATPGSKPTSWAWTGSESWLMSTVVLKPATAVTLIPNKIYQKLQAVNRASIY